MKKSYGSIVISFMGVDGSGKSTLIQKLKKDLKNDFKTIKYLHLKPYLILLDKRNVNRNPHKSKPKSHLLSFLTLIVWLLQYRIFFFIYGRKTNQLIIFDRYAHDLLIDKIRYRHNLSFSLTKKILYFFPEPHLWIILNVSSRIAEKRKKELSSKELRRQINGYKKFAKDKKNSIMLNNNKNNKKNFFLIKQKIKEFC